MSEQLRVDLDALARAATDLATIASEFGGADERVDKVTASIGSRNETHKLRAAIERAADSWDVRRAELQEDVEYLSKMATRVSEELGQMDTDLATQLNNAGQSSRPAPNAPRYV